jgi:prepilin-type N-terminal cleavage/methylation domain-containing protein
LLKQHAGDVFYEICQGGFHQVAAAGLHGRSKPYEENTSLYDLGRARKQRGLPASGGAKSASGFTMIEVLIVIVILAILMSIAIPGFSRWLPNYRLKGAARDFTPAFSLQSRRHQGQGGLGRRF